MNIKLLKRLIFATIGGSVIAGAVGILAQNNIGSDAVTLCFVGLTNTFGLTVGTYNTIFGIGMIITALILDKRKIGYTTIVYTFGAKYIIDFVIENLPLASSFIVSLIYTFTALILFGIGVSFAVGADLGLSMYDAFIFSIVDHFKFKYVITRYISDGIFLIAAIILKTYPGIGTLLILACIGVIINYIQKLLEKPLRKLIDA